MAGIIGRKLGMTQIFSDAGAAVPVTVIEAGPCPVTQIRNGGDGRIQSLQLGFGALKAKHATRAELGHAQKAGLDYAPRTLKEFRVESVDGYEVGQELKVDQFAGGRQDQGDGHDEGTRLPGRGQAPRVPRPAGEPRPPEEAQSGHARAGHEPVARDQGQEDARTDGRVAADRAQSARRARRCGAEPDLYPRRGSGFAQQLVFIRKM
jgi:hypothetical protein